MPTSSNNSDGDGKISNSSCDDDANRRPSPSTTVNGLDKNGDGQQDGHEDDRLEGAELVEEVLEQRARAGGKKKMDDEDDRLEGAELVLEVLEQRAMAGGKKQMDADAAHLSKESGSSPSNNSAAAGIESSTVEETESESSVRSLMASAGGQQQASQHVPKLENIQPALAIGVCVEEVPQESEAGVSGARYEQDRSSLPGAYACCPTSRAGEARRLAGETQEDNVQMFRANAGSNASENAEFSVLGIGVTTAEAPGVLPRSVIAHHQSSGLVEALPVEELEAGTLPRAEAHPRPISTLESKRGLRVMEYRYIRTALFCLVTVVVIGAIIVTLVIVRAPTSSNSDDPIKLLQELLPEYTLSAIHSWSDSAQARAHRWLSKDPNLWNYTNSDQLRQRFALATFYYSTNGGTAWADNTNWLSYDHHECSWFFSDQSYSVTLQAIITTATVSRNPCTRVPNSQWDFVPYSKLWMSNNRLAGTLPLELYWLTSLQSIDLELQHSTISLQHSWLAGYTHDLSVDIFGGPSSTKEFSSPDANATYGLGGTVSSYIGQLTNLQELKLSGNYFIGSLPTEIGLLSQMDLEFRILGNYFSGTLPTSLFALTSLRTMAIGNNHLSGPVRSFDLTLAGTFAIIDCIVHCQLMPTFSVLSGL